MQLRETPVDDNGWMCWKARAALRIAEIISLHGGTLLAVSGFPESEAEVFGFVITLGRVSNLPPFPGLA